MADKNINLEVGSPDFNQNKPIIHLVEGPRPYLWIGNNADSDKACFATLSDKRLLKRLAEELRLALKVED